MQLDAFMQQIYSRGPTVKGCVNGTTKSPALRVVFCDATLDDQSDSRLIRCNIKAKTTATTYVKKKVIQGHEEFEKAFSRFLDR